MTDTVTLFNTIVQKLDTLTAEVSSYRTTATAQMATLQEKQSQSDKENKQLFIFANEAKESLSALKEGLVAVEMSVERLRGTPEEMKVLRDAVRDVAVASKSRKDLFAAIGGGVLIIVAMITCVFLFIPKQVAQ